MAGTTLDFETIANPDSLAKEISSKYREWESLRQKKTEEWKELRNYLYATDTSTTSNSLLPWSNTTTTPKLTQIMDNLHANYFATLFPQQDWMKWEALGKESNTQEVAKAVTSYMKTKLRQSNFINTASDLIYDFIQYGNCFALVTFEREETTKESGEVTPVYIGPRMERISPFDIVFNPAAISFAKTPKIIRSIKSLGELARIVEEMPNRTDGFSRLLATRERVTADGVSVSKADGYIADGFSSISHYYNSDYVELLTFYGDIYNMETKTLLKDRVITIADRAFIISNEENPSWLGTAPIFHAGWRQRPDNLYAMGPLDNLVGLQYRIDHLENLKADVFDQIAYPILKIKGDVEDFEFEPGARIYLGEEADVAYLSPDTTALQADMQISILENKMEEMAGAPKQAMGIRTPGEKTAFEVQSLQNSASRIFEHKSAHFERTFIEPILNAMLEVSRRNMSAVELVPMVSDITGETYFEEISKKDITGAGKVVPIGARHFAERARRVQNLQQLYQVMASDPAIKVHISGKEFAKILTEELGESKLFGDNIQITEQLETQQKMQNAEAKNQEDLAFAAENGM